MRLESSEHLLDRSEQNALEVVDNIKSLLTPVIHYLAVKRSDQFPFVCYSACDIIQNEIESNYHYKLKLCNGTRVDTTTKTICRKHTWLEYGDLIIDPTDFQFNVISNNLPLTDENLVPKDICLDGLSDEELYNIFLQTYAENRYKKYLSAPNEKEKRFQELTILLQKGQIGPKVYSNILFAEYGSKVFYNKSDQESNIIYTADPRDAAEFYAG